MARIQIVKFSNIWKHLELEKARDALEQSLTAVETHENNLKNAKERSKSRKEEFYRLKFELEDK